MSQTLDDERRAFTGEDGRSVLDENGLIPVKTLETLTRDQSQHLLERYPLLAAASLAGRTPTFHR